MIFQTFLEQYILVERDQSINQSINQYVFQDFTRILLTGYMVNHSNNPRTDIGKPVFMTDLQMHWYRLCDDILENNYTIFGEINYNI